MTLTARVFWSLGVVAGGVLVSWVLLRTAPRTQPEEPERAAKLVQTIQVLPKDERIVVEAYGTVIPARRVIIRPEVRGRIIRHHDALSPGGYVERGAELVAIDPSDYELALSEQQAALEEARFELDVEKGRQVVAAREWAILEGELPDTEVNRSLVLREPHLRRTEAIIRRATNEIAKAKLSLSRTTIEAPFNAIILQENVEVGQLVDSGTEVCTLAGTDEFWVQATLPVDKLKWIRLPAEDRPGASAKVILDGGNGQAISWDGSVIRLLGDLEATGRMARILVRVTDPMGREGSEKMPLLLGSYVRVDLDAGELRSVVAIPRSALHEGNRIWLVNARNELQIREAEVLWTHKEHYYIANCVLPGEHLVVSRLNAPLPGMKVQPQPLADAGARRET